MFELFNDYTFRVVAIGAGLLGIISGVLGSFLVLRKESLLGDGVAHATLPGVVMAFIIVGSKNLEFLLLGGFLTGLISAIVILFIVKHSSIKFDSGLAMNLAVFFGMGIVLLTYVQKFPNANQAGLERFIYGQASVMLVSDVKIIAVCSSVILLFLLVFWKEFKLLSFDKEFAQSTGVRVKTVELLFMVLVVFSVVVGLQTVGVILMSAMLISPAVAARQWVNSLWSMVILSGVFGGVSAVVGTVISSSVSKMPTGPVIVVCSTVITFASVMFSPKHGVVFKKGVKKC